MCTLKWLAFLLVVACQLPGCKRGGDLKQFKCGCNILTDTDGHTANTVRVCSTDRATAQGVARGCASMYAHATAESCNCRWVVGKTCAKASECISRD